MIKVLRPLLMFVLMAALFLSAFRVVLIFLHWDRVQETSGLGFILLQGLSFDLVLLGLLCLPAVALAPWLLISKKTYKFGQGLLRFWLTLALIWVVFMEFATPSFIEEYDTRPNYLFVEYLSHPKEVFLTVWAAYTMEVILAVIFVPLLSIWLLRKARLKIALEIPLHPMASVGIFLLGAPLCFAMVRSTLDHRPVNPSTVAFSADAMVNTLPLSSGYTLLYALYESRLEDEGGVHYGKMDAADVYRTVKQAAGFTEDQFASEAMPTLHRHEPSRRHEKPLNYVIILQESLGAEYVGCMDGPPITPNLDAWKEKGIWFENLYATGTRSVRGIEAVITGFLPTPARSVVKLPRSQRDFFSVAQLLQKQGYETSFLYGGESHFDNMARFFTGNGFEKIVDEADFGDDVFKGSWGVCDEDLLLHAHEKFSSMGDQPFFSLIFTSSNHSPFDFPAGKFELYEKPKATVHNAVKYADWSLGEFLKLASESDYWQNTVFLIVADHNSRVRGASLVPIDGFHIPALFVGGSIEPDLVDNVASQTDLLPTALSLLGVEGNIPALGIDWTQAKWRQQPGRAIMQYHSSNAYMHGDQVIIHQRGIDAQQFQWTGTELVEVTPIDEELRKTALAHTLWPQISYQAGNYRMSE
ncbi:MAG: sulfatase-like hydrolase/transferase [Planctomycetes bacterium]|nr:sulfatase-like hydrolase/transferase [Planctomycetota bacterium]